MDNCVILNEASSVRRYKCPYCDKRDTRENLVYHIDEEHEELIPENYTAGRVVFNYVNKKECGRCTQCGKESPWVEEVWRYNRFCSEKCRQDYSKTVDKRMINTYGKKHLLNDEEQQIKMLNNRKISGEYKFKDGGVRGYVGSYERKLLEFYDKVLNVPSEHIQTPGPVIEYEYNGKKSKWITDVYYIPANLVHDAKDGGANPNNREMKEYREKQVAKEAAITKLNKYNYIRITDNDFPQLLLILAEIKHSLMDDSKEFISRINEGVATAGALANHSDGYVVASIMNNTFTSISYSPDKSLKDIYYIKDKKIKKGKLKDITEGNYKVFKFLGNNDLNIEELLADSEYPVDDDYFYNQLTGNDMIDNNQIEYDELFEECLSIYNETRLLKSIIESSLNHVYNKLTNNTRYMMLTNSNDINKAKDILKEHTNCEIKTDLEGYFIYNTITECRTDSVDSINDLCGIVGKTYLDILNTIRV